MRTVENPTYAAHDGTLFSSIDQAAKHDAERIFDGVLDGSDYEGAAAWLSSKWEALQATLAGLRTEVDEAKLAERKRRDDVIEARRAARVTEERRAVHVGQPADTALLFTVPGETDPRG
jgi:hypothetical protein